MKTAERIALATVLATTLATLLLVARNGLAPVQRPLSFGLILWAWILLFYAAIGLVFLVLAGLASRWPGRRGVSRWLVLAGTSLFVAVALASNPRAVASLFSLEGPHLFGVLVPASAILCALALPAVGAPFRGRPAAVRAGALLAVATGVLALLPGDGGGSTDGARPVETRRQGLRVALIGVDGADWDLLDPLIARGELPHFKALRDRGAWGEMETLRPTLSPPIWTSIVTGKVPRRHGVRDFTTRRLRGADNSLPDLRLLNRLGLPFLFARLDAAGQVFQAPVASFTRRVPAFWNIASALGSPVSVVNWWATWPAEPVLGYVVSERAYYEEVVAWRRTGRVEGLTYPEDLYPRIKPLIVLPGDVTLADAREFMDVTASEFEPMRVRHPSPLLGIANEFTYFHSMFATSDRLALDLLERSRRRFGESADLLVLYRIVDQTCHTALVYSDLVTDHRGAASDDLRKYAGVVGAAYRAVDRALGRIQEAFGPGNLIVVSDHGFELEGRHAYEHTDAPAGIFLAAGPAFRPGRVDGLSALDVLPLLLFLKGFPVAEDLDGDLPVQVLDPGLLAARPPRRIASYGSRERRIEGAHGTADADAQMLERLRALGYLK
jgi:Type I phosphodiesterase / nucleotide pyrophosphatase